MIVTTIGGVAMYYVKDSDYEYIMRKYNNEDSNRRFVRKDDIFSEKTGMDGDKIKEEISL
jgi:hypothetical protein